MGYKEIRPGVIRITLEMPAELFRRLEAFSKARSGPYSSANLSLVCRQLLHEGLERGGFPARKGGSKGKGGPKS